MLGHTNIKTTQHYAKILDIQVVQDMAGTKSCVTRGLINVEANIWDQGNDKASELISSPDTDSEPLGKQEPRIIKLFA
ncbi:hypothetical protein N824_02275 [Pedobacter sp. V48]|nr:hypothetical protein N824_02275 [Pedobacter sp. V48]